MLLHIEKQFLWGNIVMKFRAVLSIGAVPMGSSEGHKKSAQEHTCREPYLENCAQEEVSRSSIGAVPRDSLENHQKSPFELTCDSKATSAIKPEVQPSLAQLDRASASIAA